MSGGGSVRVTTAEDEIKDQKLVEDNDALKELVIELRNLIKYLQAILGETL